MGSTLEGKHPPPPPKGKIISYKSGPQFGRASYPATQIISTRQVVSSTKKTFTCGKEDKYLQIRVTSLRDVFISLKMYFTPPCFPAIFFIANPVRIDTSLRRESKKCTFWLFLLKVYPFYSNNLMEHLKIFPLTTVRCTLLSGSFTFARGRS